MTTGRINQIAFFHLGKKPRVGISAVPGSFLEKQLFFSSMGPEPHRQPTDFRRPVSLKSVRFERETSLGDQRPSPELLTALAPAECPSNDRQLGRSQFSALEPRSAEQERVSVSALLDLLLSH